MQKFFTKNNILLILITIITFALVSLVFSIYFEFFYISDSKNDVIIQATPTNDNPAATEEPQPISVQTLIFSKPSGFYISDITLEITPIIEGSRVFYTVDSDIPTTSSIQYNGSISITDISSTSSKVDKIMVIRAAAFDAENKLIGNKLYTMVYIINSTPFTERYSMPVISLSTKKSNLYGTLGILSHPVNKGKEWERPVNVTFFETDGTVKFNIDAGIRIFGGASRGLPQKSFKITARKEYDADYGKFKHVIFPDLRDYSGKIIDKFDSFILRNGGNDSLTTDNGASGTRDGFLHRLAYKANIDNMAYRPAIVYLNGSYYGILNLRESEDENYINSHYGIPEDKVTIMGNGNVQENKLGEMLLDNGPESELKEYSDMVKFISDKDMTIDANYQKATEMLDVDSFIRYMAFEIYIVNYDWPQNNIRVWRYNGTPNSNPYQDGKWRYMLKDIDFGFGRYPDMSYDKDTVGAVTNGGGGQLRLGDMLSNLLTNISFKNKFICYMCDMANYVMEPNSVISELNKAKAEFQPEVKRMLIKYGKSNNLTNWNKTFQTMSEFAENRVDYYLSFGKNRFQLSGLANVTVNKSDKGTIILSTVRISSGEGTWTGRYFKSVPTLITAIPNEGYSFEGFSIEGKGSIYKNYLNFIGDVTITANFN